MLRVVLEQLPERPVKLQDSNVEIKARAQPHDICHVLELPGRSPLLQQGAMRRRRKSAPTAPTVSPASLRRRIRVTAISSLASSGSTSLQSRPRNTGTQRTAVNGCGFSSTIKHQSALHS